MAVALRFAVPWRAQAHPDRLRAGRGAAGARPRQPTNHLDAPARALVAQALASFKGVGLLVSHDRTLLDGLVQSCVFVEAGRAVAIPGTYTQARRELDLRQETVRTERRQAREKLARIRNESARRDGVAARASARRSARHLDRHDRDGRAKIKLAVYSGQDGKAGSSSQMDKRIEAVERGASKASI